MQEFKALFDGDHETVAKLQETVSKQQDEIDELKRTVDGLAQQK